MSFHTIYDKFFSSNDWNSSKIFLKTLVHTLKDFQVKNIDDKVCSLHHSLEINQDGFNTYFMKNLGTLYINLKNYKIFLQDKSGKNKFELDFTNKSIGMIFDQLKAQLKSFDEKISFNLSEDQNNYLLTSSTVAAEYFTIIWDVFTILARIKSRLPLNASSPLVYWTHHFDMGFMYFYKGKYDSEQDPHINIGFTPWIDKEGSIKKPYFYLYVWNGKEYVKGFETIEPIYWQNHFTVLELSNSNLDLERILAKFVYTVITNLD